MTTKEHLAVHDKQIAAIRALIKEGMLLVAAERKERIAMRKELRQLGKDISRLVAGLGQQPKNGKHTNGGAR